MSKVECEIVTQIRRALHEARSKEPSAARAPDTLFVTEPAYHLLLTAITSPAERVLYGADMNRVFGLRIEILRDTQSERFALGRMDAVGYRVVP